MALRDNTATIYAGAIFDVFVFVVFDVFVFAMVLLI